MLTEDWVELIKHVLSPTAFKEVGMAALRVMYGHPVVLADGTDDGGVDAWMEQSPSSRVPVQFHAGKAVAWDRKLALDIQKPLVRDSGAGRYIFICAQTPAPESAQRKLAELEREHGINVTLVDARGIASYAGDPEVFEALRKVSPALSPGRPASLSAAAEARLAFAFFHEASGDFRAEVARSVLSTCLVRAAAPMPTEQVLEQALALVGGGIHLKRLFRRQLQRLIASGDVVAEGDALRAGPAFVESTKAILRIQAGAAERLRADCVRALEGRVHSPELRRQAVDAVFDDLGLLLRQSLVEKLPGARGREAAARLNAIERRLADVLKPSGGTARDALEALIDVASRSMYGRALASAELFMQLTERNTTEVTRILTRRDRVEVILDTSVAMPTLCGALDRVAKGWVTSEITGEMRDLLRARDIPMVVPHLYLEEMAAHLTIAAKHYRAVIGQDPDLSRSENFFVAHYHTVQASLGEAATTEGFDELLSDLGFPADADTADPVTVRRRVEQELKEHFEFYGIAVSSVKYIEALPLPDEPLRDEKVLMHDRCVTRWLDERARESRDGLLLCTQDRWLIQALAGRHRDWIALDPAGLVDIVQLVRPEGAGGRLASLRDLASRLDEDVSMRAAAVWDFLARLEGPRLADRELLRQAKQFKEEWLRRDREAERPHAKDWLRFKSGLSMD